MNESVNSFLYSEMRTYGRMMIPFIMKFITDNEVPGSLYELSKKIEDGTFKNKYLFLTDKRIMKIYSDKVSIDIENIYLKEINSFEVKSGWKKDFESIEYIIEKIEIKLKNNGIIEIELNKNKGYSQDIEKQRKNALVFLIKFNEFLK